MKYSDKLMDHFINPRNVGEIVNSDGIGQIGDPNCGDFLKVWILFPISLEQSLQNLLNKNSHLQKKN